MGHRSSSSSSRVVDIQQSGLLMSNQINHIDLRKVMHGYPHVVRESSVSLYIECCLAWTSETQVRILLSLSCYQTISKCISVCASKSALLISLRGCSLSHWQWKTSFFQQHQCKILLELRTTLTHVSCFKPEHTQCGCRHYCIAPDPLKELRLVFVVVTCNTSGLLR